MSAYRFYIGKIEVPGYYQKILCPSREINWSIQGGAGGGLGASTIWRGVKIPEGGIGVETLLVDDLGRPIDDVVDAQAIWVPFILSIYPDPKAKPPVFSCFHPILVGRIPVIADCSIHTNDLVSPKGDHLSWHGLVILQTIVPAKKIRAAPPDPAKLSQKAAGPEDAAEAFLADLAKEAGF